MNFGAKPPPAKKKKVRNDPAQCDCHFIALTTSTIITSAGFQSISTPVAETYCVPSDNSNLTSQFPKLNTAMPQPMQEEDQENQAPQQQAEKAPPVADDDDYALQFLNMEVLMPQQSQNREQEAPQKQQQEQEKKDPPAKKSTPVGTFIVQSPIRFIVDSNEEVNTMAEEIADSQKILNTMEEDSFEAQKAMLAYLELAHIKKK